MSDPPIGKIIIGVLVAMAVVLAIGLLPGSQGGLPSLPAFIPETTPASATTPTATPAPTSTEIEIKPTLIKEWKGSGNTTTDQFTITDELWLVSWANNPVLIEGKSTGYL